MGAWTRKTAVLVSLAAAVVVVVFFALPTNYRVVHAVPRVRDPARDAAALTANPVLAEMKREESNAAKAVVTPTPSSGPSVQQSAQTPKAKAALSLRNRGSSLQLVSDASSVLFKRVVRASKLPASVLLMREKTRRKLAECGQERLGKMFEATYANTLETTVNFVSDGSVYVITGDIDNMWLRDSAAQVSHYIEGGLARDDVQVQVLIEGVIRRQIHFISVDAYANSFKIQLNNNPSQEDKLLRRGGHVSTGNYELDSLCYFLRLSFLYWNATRDITTQVFDNEWVGAVRTIVDLMVVEQRHHEKSPYVYIGLGDELPPKGRGGPVGFTGMTWTGFRPSDDACKYGYLIPANAMAVTTLEWVAAMLRTLPGEHAAELATRASNLSVEIDNGIHKYGVTEVPGYGKIYAYEVNGLGGVNLMDDANVPSLLSLTYMRYKSPHDPKGEIAANTRRWVLSKENPFLVEGAKFRGIGSPHTPRGNIWPMSLIVEALTSEDPKDVLRIFQALAESDAGTNLMHESFAANNPASRTRDWFAWANSLFSEAIIAKIGVLCPK